MTIRGQLELLAVPQAPDPCARCPERARADRIADDLLGNEAELRSYKRVIRELKRDRARERRESPMYRQARELYEYWLEATGRDGGRCRFGDDRQETALKALGQYELHRLKHTIEGFLIDPWKRGDKVYDEFCTILKGSRSIEHFEQVFERAQNGHPGGTTRERAARVPACSSSPGAQQAAGRPSPPASGRTVELPAWLTREAWEYEIEACAYPCSHPRLFHIPDEQGRLSCRMCGCVEFDDLDARIAEWHRAEADRLARSRARRLGEETDDERGDDSAGRGQVGPLPAVRYTGRFRAHRDAGNGRDAQAAAAGP